MNDERFEKLDDAAVYARRRRFDTCVVLRFDDGREIFIELHEDDMIVVWPTGKTATYRIAGDREIICEQVRRDGPWVICESLLPDVFSDGPWITVIAPTLHDPVMFKVAVTGETWESRGRLKAIFLRRRSEANRGMGDDLPLKPAS